MRNIETLFKTTCRKYNRGESHYLDCFNLSKNCISKLLRESEIVSFGQYQGKPPIQYHVFEVDSRVSRPFRKPNFIDDLETFEDAHNLLISKLKSSDILSSNEISLATNVIYTCLISFAACYDLWKNSARKTPGTFFEILMAGLFRLYLPENAILSKHINLTSLVNDRDKDESRPSEIMDSNLEGQEKEEELKEALSTDLVLTMPDSNRSAIVPLKITTRERIVQPYAHQRIVDSALPHEYESFLACISETQLDKKSRSVKQVCVPGTIKLFQKYLGKLSGIYYCDLPQRYASEDLAKYVSVKPLGAIFEDVRKTIVPPK